MVEARGCPYCARWHAEVGPAYANSPEAQFAPLERIEIGSPELARFRDLRYTPTFILVDGNRELGRITGYPGADFFWAQLSEFLSQTPFGKGAVAIPS